MWKQTLFDGSDLGLSKPFQFTELSSIVLPRMRKSMIFLPSGELRAYLEKTGGQEVVPTVILKSVLVQIVLENSFA